MISAHIKDIAPEGQNADEDGWADVGTGTMDWAAIHAALQNAGCERYILEHDKPSDHVRFAETSVAAVRAF
jgi:sugar phosphate isomerase/epimerase